MFRHPRTGQLWQPAGPAQRALLIRHGWQSIELPAVLDALNGMYLGKRPADLASCRVCFWTAHDEVYIAARSHVRLTRHTVDLILDGSHREPMTRTNTPRPGEAA